MIFPGRWVRASLTGGSPRRVGSSGLISLGGCCCAAINVVAFGSLAANAQEFSISSIELRNGVFQVNCPGRADSYYLLNSIPFLWGQWQPVSAQLGSAGTLSFEVPAGSEAEFFRIEQLPLTATNDIIGDGISDAFKLLHGLAVFGPSEANTVPVGSTNTWLEIYQAQTFMATLPVAYFSAPSYSVIVGTSSISVPVTFTKPFTGRFTYQLTGTAIPSGGAVVGDYLQPAGSVYCNNATNATIPITLVPEPDIEVNRSIVIALSAPPLPLTNQTYTITTNSSVATVQLLQSTAGIYLGSMVITNAPTLGAQAVKMAIRPGNGTGSVALLDVTGNALLGNTFSVPVTFDANGFQLNGGHFSNALTTLWGQSLKVDLVFGPTQTNGVAFITPVTLTIAGLTGSGVAYSGSGALTLCRAQ